MTQESFAVDFIKELIPTAANQLWVSEITYIAVFDVNNHYQFCYLTIIMDSYSEEVKGYCVGDSLETKYSIVALEMALKCLEGKDKHDSNWKSEGKPQAERINSTIKNEFLKGIEFHSMKDVVEAITNAVDFYNNERPHMSIGMMTPFEASQCIGERDMKWTCYRERAIKKLLEMKNAENGLPLASCHGSPSGLRPPVNP